MPHLAVMRRGWQNEHLAAFILSKLAFVAQPAKIGDDVGTDFFCTFFEVLAQSGTDYLIPKSSFAIQIKSSGASIDATKQIEYLTRLELPFFVGIVDQERSTLTIYSGEYLPILLSHKGIPKSLIMDLDSGRDFGMDSYFVDKGDNSFTLKCPLVATLSATMTSEAVAEASRQLREVASSIQRNIAARTSNEYVFGIGVGGRATVIMAGPGSVDVFRENFKRRLAEACRNLSWLADSPNYELDIGEGRFYAKIYDDMLEQERDLPAYLTNAAEELKARLTA